jgi:streptogramin lyase
MTRRRLWSLLALLATSASVLVLTVAAPASAGFQTFSGPDISQPVGMAAAPDGTLWFANYGSDTIGEVDATTGTVTSHADANIDGPRSVTVAPDGVVWFTSTENGRLGKIDAGVVTTYPAIEQIDDVEVAADGDIWFNGFPSTGDERIGRFEPDTEDLYTYTVPGFVYRMTADPTAGVWFAWSNASGGGARIRHITPPALITDPPTITGFSSAPATEVTDLTFGPDGRIWFTAEDAGQIARMNPSTGAVTVFTHPQVRVPNEIIEGPGGDLWFTIRSGGRFGRIDPSTGAIVTYRDPTDTVEGPIGLAVGGDGNLWYTRVVDGTNDLVGRLVLDTCQGQEVTVDLRLGSTPTAGDDVIIGSNGGNTIFAGGGNDLVCALGGNDKVYGQAGKDRLYLGAGQDTGSGGDGSDRVYGDTGDDVIVLGSGADRAFGEDDADSIAGEDGADVLDGGADADALNGGAGTDACHGGLGRDTGVSCESRTGIP